MNGIKNIPVNLFTKFLKSFFFYFDRYCHLYTTCRLHGDSNIVVKIQLHFSKFKEGELLNLFFLNPIFFLLNLFS